MKRPFVKIYEDDFYLDFLRTLSLGGERHMDQTLTKLRGIPYFYGTARLFYSSTLAPSGVHEVTFVGAQGEGRRGTYQGLRPIMRWFDRIERRYL